MDLDVLYFAWVRERIGCSRERVETQAGTVADLLRELALRSDGHRLALEDHGALRVAVNQRLAALDSPVAGAREIAVFPPMTGG